MTVNTVSTFLAIGAILLDAGLVSLILLWLGSLVSDRAAAVLEAVSVSFHGLGLRVAWATAIVATAGSLYYSEMAHFIPCEFCWYQRIAMYPLTVVLAVAVFRRDIRARAYVVPLAVAGAGLATYHYLIQQFPSLEVGACSTIVPCTSAWVWKFGFVSIPFMAFACFGLIVAALLLDQTLRPATGQKMADDIDEEAM
jgi:disulfide bond formation protein DsbB